MINIHDGRVTLNGVEIANASPDLTTSTRDVRSRINIVPQDLFLVPSTTARFNIDPYSRGSSDKEIVGMLQRLDSRIWSGTRVGWMAILMR